MARLRRNEDKKTFNLQVPISTWEMFEDYCKSLGITPTKGLNNLIASELIEAKKAKYDKTGQLVPAGQ